MSSEFAYPVPQDEDRFTGDAGPEFPVPEDEEAPGARGVEKGLKTLIIAAASALILELLWLLVISPCMPLSRLEVNSFPGLDREEALRRAGIGERSSYISVNPRSAEKNLEDIREVESARVVKRFPNSVTISLVPRVAVAVAFDKIDGRQRPVYIDRHGVIFKTGKAGASSPQVPVISGLPPGETLPAIYLPLFNRLDRIRSADPRLLQTISEIRVNRKPFDGFDLVLYPAHSPIRVRLEPNLNEETLRYVMLMLDVFAERNQEIEEIDFRTETASYKLKEASSG
jgi:cell division protein FtsQ